MPFFRMHSRDNSYTFSKNYPGEGEHVHHLVAPGGGDVGGGSPQCLVWACKACKRLSRGLDRRQAATVRERKRLGKVLRKMMKDLLLLNSMTRLMMLLKY